MVISETFYKGLFWFESDYAINIRDEIDDVMVRINEFMDLLMKEVDNKLD
jgi:hypothetical protein